MNCNAERAPRMPGAGPAAALAWTGLFLTCALVALFAVGCSSSLERPSSRAAAEARAQDEVRSERRVKASAHFATAISAEANQDLETALKHFIAAAYADPEDESLVLQVAGRLLEVKRSEEAVSVLLRANAQPHASARVSAWLALAYASQDKTAQAIAANRSALTKDPTLLLAYQHLSTLYLEHRQPAEALKVLDEAAAQPVTRPGQALGVAELYSHFARRRPEDAEAVKPRILRALDRATALRGSDLALTQRLGDSYKQLGEWDKAEALYRELIEKDADLPLVRESLVDLYLRTGKVDRASEHLEVLARDFPANEQASFILGTIAYQHTNYVEAERQFDRTRALKPDFPPAYYELASVKLALKKPAEALELLAEAGRRFPKTFQLEFLTGLAQAQAKRYDEAIKHYTEAEIIARATETGRLPILYFQLGAACERHGDFAEAAKHFRRCLELAPDFAEALNYLGYMWAERGENLDEARTLIEKALKLEPDNGAFLDSLGWVLFKQGQPKAALDWLRKAIAHTEEPDATLYDHLGDVHAALGEQDAAREAWRKSLEIEASDAVRKKLDGASPGSAHQP
jgi:tetratricopeptide (TPR) repeat protein